MTTTLETTRSTTINIPATNAFADVPTELLHAILGGLKAEANSWDMGGNGYTPRNPRKAKTVVKVQAGKNLELIGGKARKAYEEKMTITSLKAIHRAIRQAEDAVVAELESRKA